MIAHGGASHLLADRVHRPGHVQADPTRQMTGKQPTAQRPVRRVQAAGMHSDAEMSGLRLGNIGVFEEAYAELRRLSSPP